MIICLIGPSGAGKGTQADRIARARGFRHLSTGDLFRDHLERGTALGRRVRRYVEEGDLVPDHVTETMLREHLASPESERNVLLDGYPRTEAQARALDDILEEIARSLGAVVYLDVSDRTLAEDRIPGRLTCRSCQRPYHVKFRAPKREGRCDVCGGTLYRRPDDTPERARLRLRNFHRDAAPLVEHYRRHGRLMVVSGEGSIDGVQRSLEAVLDDVIRVDDRLAGPGETERIRDLREPARTIAEPHRPTLDLVLLGAPGSGKGTQASALSEHFGIPHVATGDLFREHLRNDTELGRMARAYMDEGELVPDDVTQTMVRERLASEDTKEGFVLDGFPRTLSQADALTDILTDFGRRLSGVLYIEVSHEEVVRRLAGRRICPNCQRSYHVELQPPKREGVCDACGGELYQRDDDNPETVRSRLRTFHEQTKPLVRHYEDAGLLTPISGEGEIDEVTRRALKVVEDLDRR